MLSKLSNKNIKNRKAAGVDGIIPEMLKCRDVGTKQMVMMCEVAREGEVVPAD